MASRFCAWHKLRSLGFTTDGEEGYLDSTRTSLSNDASLVIADTNFSQPGRVRVISVEIGIGSRASR
jgi:hypothetical protein